MENESKEIGVDEFFQSINIPKTQGDRFVVDHVVIKIEGGSYAILSLLK